MKRQCLLYILMMTVFMSVLTGMTVAAEDLRSYYERHYYAYNLMGKNKTVSLYAGEEDEFVSISSSNKKVAMISKEKVKGDDLWFDVKLINPGKEAKAIVKIVQAYEDEESESGEYIETNKYLFVFYKYTNPFKSLKIGKKNFASKFKKGFIYDKVPANTSGKISYSLKKNWKVESIYYSNSAKKPWRSIKKGTKIKFTKRGKLSIFLINKKTGVAAHFILGRKTREKPFFGFTVVSD